MSSNFLQSLRGAALALVVLPLAACGDAIDAVGSAANEAVRAAGEVVDTRTACMIAGQGEAFCTCAQEALGPKLDPERLKQVTGIAVEAARTGSLEAAAQKAEIPAETRDAVVRCATRAAVQGAIGVEGEAAEGGEGG